MKTITRKQDLESILVRGNSFALFSGSFNPPHFAHLKLVEYALEKHVDSVIVCPHSHNPYKQDELIDIENRVELLTHMINGSQYEYKIHIGLPPIFDGIGQKELHTIASIKKKINPLCRYWILCGSDVIHDDYFEFKRDIPHIVHMRENGSTPETLNRLKRILKTDLTIIPHISDISSTVIKKSLRGEK